MKLDTALLIFALTLSGCASTVETPPASDATSTPKAPAPPAARVQPLASPTPQPAARPVASPKPPPAAQELARPAPAPVPKPPIRPEISAVEEQKLIEEATRKIDDVERLVRELDGRTLKAPQQEVLLTAKNLLAEAKSALGARDFHRAANLASKARTLSDDLADATK